MRFEIWRDPDVGDWNVSEHYPDGGEDIIAELMDTRAEAERWVADILWLEEIDR